MGVFSRNALLKNVNLASVSTKVALFCLGLILGFVLQHEDEILPTANSIQASDVREKNSGYQFISPLLECDSNFTSGTQTLTLMNRNLTQELNDLQRASTIPTLAVYVRDFNNGPWFGYNEKIDFAPASLMKVPIMLAVYKEAEKDPTILSKLLRTPGEINSETATTTIGTTVLPGVEYTLEQLVEYMITYSDNLATETILNFISMETVQQVFTHVGVPVDTVEQDLALSVKEYASFFRVLYNASFLTREYSERALKLLTATTFTNALVAGLPEGTPVAHKWGIRTRNDLTEKEQLHDCGIVYYPGHPYLLCVMTRGNDALAQSELIREVSRAVYSEVSDSLQENSNNK
jgi:beta-lactamase class A